MDFLLMNTGLIATLLFFGVFTGIALWAYWPANKDRLQNHAYIPLKEGEHGGQ
jgi:cbb3-type cytochrome oxidase subunit 3